MKIPGVSLKKGTVSIRNRVRGPSSPSPFRTFPFLRIMATSVCLFFILSLAGCASTRSKYTNLQSEDKNAIRTLTGGVLGVLVDGTTFGAIAGAFMGDVVMNAIFREKKRPYIPLEQEEEEARKKEYENVKLFIEEQLVDPQSVKTGATVEANVRYSLYLALPETTIRVHEQVVLEHPDKTLELANREVERAGGEHLMRVSFIIPDNIPKGDYTFLTTISNGPYSKRARSAIKII